MADGGLVKESDLLNPTKGTDKKLRDMTDKAKQTFKKKTPSLK